jgi:hypothetical protein
MAKGARGHHLAQYVVSRCLSFLGDGEYRAVVFADGVNARREATDYEMTQLSAGDALRGAPGAGGRE